MAEATIDVKWDISAIVATAGGDPKAAMIIRGNVLVASDVTQSALDKAIADFDASANDAKIALLEVQNTRAEAYASLADQLDMQYWDKINGTEKWKEHVDAVKAAHAKPSS